MKRSKRERKISKVMGEFKDGTLKSGGSGRKVTNPKQAIAIALSEAEGMNQGGMMYNQIMQRPMFQTPQQRQGMGIMAGVAPVRGYEEGGMAVPEYTPKFLREEEPSFFSFEKTEPGSGINLRDLTDLFIVDPEDPEDVAIASATIPLMAFPPAAIAARLANAGYKASKAIKAAKKAAELQEKMPGFFGKGTSRAKTYGQAQGIRTLEDVGEMVADAAMNNEAEDFARGGIASLPIMQMSLGGEAIKGLFDFVTTYGSRGLDFIQENLKQLNPKQAEQIVEQAKKADKVLGEPGAETVEQGQRLILKKPKPVEPKMTADDIATPPESKMPTPPKPPAKVADDAAEAAKEAGKKADKKPITQRVRRSVPGQVVSGALKPITSPIKVGAPLVVGGIAIDKLIQSGALDEYIKDPRVQQAIQAGKPVYEAITEFFGPIGEALFPDTGERVELTESAQARLPEVEKARKEGFPEPPKDAKKDDGTGTPKPEATGIMKFLFGKDGIGGEPGFAGRLLEKTQDPRLQYQLARAGQATEGRVPRNFYSDFVLAGAEYDELQGKDKTALMQNYEFLKQTGKSDDEIFDLLLSKDTASDQAERYQDQVLSLFNAARKDPNNTGRSTAELLEEARSTAAAIILNQSVATPTDSEAIETVDLE